MLLTSTASAEEFGIGQSVVSLPLNPGGTTSITFQADRVALEPDETFVFKNSNYAIFCSINNIIIIISPRFSAERKRQSCG